MSKNKTVDFQNAKDIIVFKKYLKKFRVLIALALVVIVILVTCAALGDIGNSNFTDSFRSISSSFSDGGGYPYNSNLLVLNKFMLIGDKPLIVSENGIDILSQEAVKLYSLHLEWTDAKATTKNGRALLFSNTSDKVYLVSRTKKLAEYNAAGTLITADIATNGGVALASTGENGKHQIKVITNRKNEEFVWESSKDYVSSVGLSGNGRKLAASVIGVDNAQLYSRILFFSTKDNKPYFEKYIDGTTIVKVIFTTGGKIIAVGDNYSVIYDQKGELVQEIKYSDNSLFSTVSDSEGNTVICCKEFGGSKMKLFCISKSGKIQEFEIKYTPSSIDIRGSKIAVSYDDKVTVHSYDGTVKETYKCSGKVSSAFLSTSGIFTVENGAICKY